MSKTMFKRMSVNLLGEFVQVGAIAPNFSLVERKLLSTPFFLSNELDPSLVDVFLAQSRDTILETENRDKKPYIFALTVREWMTSNDFECYHLDADGNTVVDFESQGMGSLAELDFRLGEWVAKREADGILLDKETKRLRKFFGIASDALDYKYLVEAWMNKTFTNNDFPKSDSMILAYITENEQNITDEEKYTEELTKFKTEFFDFLIKCLKQLRDEIF